MTSLQFSGSCTLHFRYADPRKDKRAMQDIKLAKETHQGSIDALPDSVEIRYIYKGLEGVEGFAPPRDKVIITCKDGKGRPQGTTLARRPEEALEPESPSAFFEKVLVKAREMVEIHGAQ